MNRFTIKVGAKHYRVSMSKAAWKRLKGKDEEAHSLMGRTDHVKGRIYVMPGRNMEERKETVVHELLHTLFYDSGVAPSSLAAEDDHSTEENFVSMLSPRLYALLVENPNVVRWLIGDPPASAPQEQS